MEIGGYRELDLRTGLEYYAKERLARLNMGRSGIYHALRCLNCKKVLMPYYQCETVRNFLFKKGIEVQYYHIGENLLPTCVNSEDRIAIVLVNYFGLIPQSELERFVKHNRNVIIDNTQGFYQANIHGAYSVYSPRKFFGVADGCYVIGTEAERFLEEYEQDYSAETATFLLQRIETGGNANYAQYQKSEQRLERSDIRRMSKLTYALLDNIDYESIKAIRQKNYDYAAQRFAMINELPPTVLKREVNQVPMVYPLVISDDKLRYYLKDNDIFVGQWWKYLLDNQEITTFERKLSRYLLPIQIDQRYGKEEIDREADMIFQALA